MEIDMIPEVPNGDIGLYQESDRRLEEFGEVLEALKKMPKLDTTVRHYSQYTNKRNYTACTIFSGINNLATTMNYDFSEQELNDIMDYAISRGFNPGGGWIRGCGNDTVRKRWNLKHPDNKVLLFVVDINSEEYKLVMEKLGTASISIYVDSSYRKDTRDNLIIDGEGFGKTNGHATCLCNHTTYKCIDSVPRSYVADEIGKPMIYTFGDKINTMFENGNIGKDAHVFIMESWLKEPDMPQEEKDRLINFRTELEKTIAANSAIRHLTNQESEKMERNKQNNYNRAKLGVINSLLS